MIHIILAILLIACTPPATAEDKGTPVNGSMPTYRVDSVAFKASASDIKAVCDSAGSQLWRHFSQYEIDPFLVQRGDSGPFFCYNKNARGELVILLATGGTYWSQYAYQFSHEFCHLLCGRENKEPRYMWFEETLAETASLYALRAMSKEWETNPPYQNWKEYRDSLRTYADNIALGRTNVYAINEKGLANFYRTHKEALEREPCDRALNGAMALVLLRLFEAQPEHWETLRWLNSSPPHQSKTFQQHLSEWRDAVPEEHKAFIEKIAGLFGVPINHQ